MKPVIEADVSPSARPLVYRLYETPLSGAEIEARSFAAIDAEAPPHDYTPEQWQVVRRMIHTCADFGLIGEVVFSVNAVQAAGQALRGGATIYCDSNMIRSGLSLARLRAVNPEYTAERILCHVADPDVAQEAALHGLPRSLYAVRKAGAQLDGAIVLIGNAPVALLELNRMILERQVRPALIIGMPVGFVHVLESKQELIRSGVPYVVLNGRRGGSPLAVSVLHALAQLSTIAGKQSCVVQSDGDPHGFFR